MKQLVILIFCAIVLQAGLLDFVDASNAKKSYEKKDYKSAIKLYSKIQGKDGAAYDLANSYYKNKNYKKALSEYEKVSNPKLKFQKLHNMGNTYANLGKIDDAIKSYEEALKIKKDKDTKYNLDLLKKKKNKKKKKDKKKNNKSPKKKDKKDKKNGKNQKKDKNQKKSQNKQENKKGQKSQGEREKQKQNKDKQQNRQNKQQKQEKKGKGQKNKKASAQKNKKVQPISDMEERKYKKMLNQRGINTLMLPLSTKGEKRNEENPW